MTKSNLNKARAKMAELHYWIWSEDAQDSDTIDKCQRLVNEVIRLFDAREDL